MDDRSRWRRFVLAGAAGVLAIQAAGRLTELARLGGSDDAAFARVERRMAGRFGEMAAALESLAGRLAADPEVVERIDGDPAALPRLFAVLRDAADAADAAVTIYGANGSPRAWTGRPSEAPVSRILDDRTFFVAPGPLGLRLVYVEPVLDRPAGGGRSRRIGAIAAEQVLSAAPGMDAAPSDAFRLDDPIADVVVRAWPGLRALQTGQRAFELRSPQGAPLLEAVVSSADLRAARRRWRRALWNLTLTFAALIVLAAAGAGLLRRPPRGASAGEHLRRAGLAVGGAGAAALLLRAACAPTPAHGRLFSPEVYASIRFPGLLRSPADLLVCGAFTAVLALIAAAVLERVRPALRRARLTPTLRRTPWFLLAHLSGGAALAAIAAGLHAVTEDAAFASSVDLLHTSFSPWDAGRIGLLAGLLLAAVGSVWGGAVVLVAVRTFWRHPRRDAGPTAAAVAAWAAPGLAAAAATGRPATPLLALLAGAVPAALFAPAARRRLRHASHASRLLAALLAAAAPALLLYPSLWRNAERAKRQLVETRFAGQAARYPDALQARLGEALAQIDAIPDLPEILSPSSGRQAEPADADRAFSVWRRTGLAQLRLTSAIELYDAEGRLVSRFALNFPEYEDVPQDWISSRCEWEIFGEAAPFGSEERRILHGDRALCASDGAGGDPFVRGSVVVHLALDYQALPFISPGSPYAAVLRASESPPPGPEPGRDVELVIYGWGLQPVFASGPDAWLLDDALFARIRASREPFWTRRPKGEREYELYLANNRAGVYALGYPAFSAFDHLVRLVEIAAFMGVLGCALLPIAVCAAPWAADRRRFGAALLLEVRTSFHRRLLLAFVGAAVIPMLAVAAAIRTYYTARLRADVETGAARTAAVAKRVIEESIGRRQTNAAAAAVINDDLLVFISQSIDQDVNLFEGPQLIATSERDLFASGLLPTRTPHDVYDAVALGGMTSYVAEDAIGSLRHLVAATPIRAGGRDAILTVPLASRQQEIENQIADLDRGILLGAALFIVLGAGSGFYLAERIADPVKRLTRATRQLARGNFDTRIAVRSADELQRLVAAFNRMAIDLQDQQRRLERTHRLEAWAEMARQVAHEIKNPLTPVQLSAEHLLRVHRDRGEPLGPVLQNCVDSILAQVRMLRRISSEFSSYASSPAVTREPTRLAAIVRDVLAPYLAGLEGRIAVTVDVPSAGPAVLVDRVLTARALTNVIDNALHAMPGRGTLGVRVVTSPSAAELIVTDTGGGVDPETLRRIFEPYFSTKVSGTGLGMAIAKRNVELSGGAIRVESRKDRGATVTLTFPVAAAS